VPRAVGLTAGPLPLRGLLEAYGPDRLLWGSDWPHTNTELDRITTYPKMLQSLAEWVPDAATRRRILQDTPMRLFGFTS
jgi:predicted TIM-barrel fold metal-dependent hydrolase